MTRTEAIRWRHKIEHAATHLTDEEALESVELFPMWREGVSYEFGIRVQYEGKLYRCEQGHTSQEDWHPDVTPALWTEVSPAGEIPVWRQPTGAQDSYRVGDKVWYPDRGDKVYICVSDYNIYAPDVFGWEEVV